MNLDEYQKILNASSDLIAQEERARKIMAGQDTEDLSTEPLMASLYTPETEMISQLADLNDKLSTTNQALQSEREERSKESVVYNEKISSLQNELQKLNDANKWQTLKDLLIGLAGAVVGSSVSQLFNQWDNVMQWFSSLFT